MSEKDKEKKIPFPVDTKPLSEEEAKEQIEEVYKHIEESLKGVPKEEIEEGVQRLKEFVEGRLSWADLFNFTPEMLFQMAEHGLAQFKTGRYEDAERVFKVLTLLDWENPYYHSVMGTILQRQKRYGEAIAQYNEAIDLMPEDTTSLTNRGEIYMQHGLLEEAIADFESAIKLDPDGEDKWSNRARVLRLEIARQLKEKELKEGEKGAGAEKKKKH